MAPPARSASLLLVLLRFSLAVGCLCPSKDVQVLILFKAGFKPKPIVDLNDERDDGQTLTLVYSENIIVPPEEDEDPSDDQAPDIDKKEDLEDLDSVMEVHILKSISRTEQIPRLMTRPGKGVTPRPHEYAFGRYQIETGDGPRALNQLLLVAIVILSFLLCLVTTICLVLLVKIKFIARSKRCLMLVRCRGSDFQGSEILQATFSLRFVKKIIRWFSSFYLKICF